MLLFLSKNFSSSQIVACNKKQEGRAGAQHVHCPELRNSPQHVAVRSGYGLCPLSFSWTVLSCWPQPGGVESQPVHSLPLSPPHCCKLVKKSELSISSVFKCPGLIMGFKSKAVPELPSTLSQPVAQASRFCCASKGPWGSKTLRSCCLVSSPERVQQPCAR